MNNKTGSRTPAGCSDNKSILKSAQSAMDGDKLDKILDRVSSWIYV